ncbi:MAG: VWA domain-containing protein, partial [Methanomicrobium sp.]|nr:VWA domain-containing protein [Methanomicrobium sp.]
TVEFSIEPGSYPAYHTANPLLSAASAITDENGQAIVSFTPGSFLLNTNDPLYEELSSANCTVKAKWGGVERDILLEWKNFPYLSVESEVNPETVEVNGTVDVTIRLIGDGWALLPDPIDVMLCADRSGSMLMDYPDRMVTVMGAMKGFTSAMSEGRDRIGLTSFGTSGEDVNILVDYYSYGDVGHYWAGEDGKIWVEGYYLTDEFGNYVLSKWGRKTWVSAHWESNPNDDADYIKYNYTGNGFTDYATPATLDQNLTLYYSDVNDAINKIVPMQGTPMRGGIYLALKQLIENPNKDSDAVRAVIVLSDGDYTDGDSNGNGDPLARPGNDYCSYFGGSAEENLSVYAKNNNIKIYTIAFAETLSEEGRKTLKILGESTGGKFYNNVDASNINDVYRDIAGDLKTEAGVNTQMNLDFSNIELNNVTVPNSQLDPILEYKCINNVSTVITKWNKTDTVISRHTIDNINNSWSTERALNFDVGTIKLSETWETTFRLKVLKGGNINIFGTGSTITFNNGTDSLTLPKTYVTAVENLTATGINFKDLFINDLHSTNTGKITDTLNIKWNLTYTGEDTAEQKVFYMRTSDNAWIEFQKVLSGPGNSTNDAQLIVRDLPPGTYTVRVHAKSPDTADSIAELSHPVIIGDSSATYIKIE